MRIDLTRNKLGESYMLECEFVEKINSIHGRAYVAGGWVRDTLRGVEPKDKDYVITGVLEADFNELFPQAIKVGKSFPVYLLEIDGLSREIAFARREHSREQDAVSSSPTISIVDDLFRRDTTMNSMAFDLQTQELIDPFQGKEHIAEQKIRPTSHHFKDDPVRALRAARQSAQFGFAIDPLTTQFMQECRERLTAEPKERLFTELEKALQSDRPSTFFLALRKANLLDITYPQIYALIGQTQPVNYHPEGDAFNHTMEVIDQVAQLNPRVEVRFAALVHDLGKGLTPKERLPAHHLHDVLGLDALKAFDQHIGFPNKWLACAQFTIQNHMRVTQLKQKGKIVDFIAALSDNPIGSKGFSDIVFADKGYIPDCLLNFTEYLTAMRQIKGTHAPGELRGKEIGNWIRMQQIKVYSQQKQQILNR